MLTWVLRSLVMVAPWSGHPGVLASQHSLAGVDLTGASPASSRVSLSGLFEHGEGAEIFRVVAICHSRDLIVVPIEETRLYGRFEATEDLNITQLARLVACFTTALVRLYLQWSKLMLETKLSNFSSYLLYNCLVILNESLLQCFSFLR